MPTRRLVAAVVGDWDESDSTKERPMASKTTYSVGLIGSDDERIPIVHPLKKRRFRVHDCLSPVQAAIEASPQILGLIREFGDRPLDVQFCRNMFVVEVEDWEYRLSLFQISRNRKGLFSAKDISHEIDQ